MNSPTTVIRNMIFPYLSLTPQEMGMHSDVLWFQDPWAVYPSAVLAEPPFGGSLIMLRGFFAIHRLPSDSYSPTSALASGRLRVGR